METERARHPLTSRPAVLSLLAVLLTTFGIWARQETDAVRDDLSVRNTALTDGARTSEVKGAVANMVALLFSYDHTDPGKTHKAARTFLTGAAPRQYETLFAKVKTDAPEHRTVLGTRVTDSAVTALHGDKARVLVFAVQQTTRTTDGRTSSAPAMLAIDAVRRNGHWRITALDTF